MFNDLTHEIFPGTPRIKGVMYWESGDDKRILYTVGSFLYAVNAKNGKSILSFGNNGSTFN